MFRFVVFLRSMYNKIDCREVCDRLHLIMKIIGDEMRCVMDNGRLFQFLLEGSREGIKEGIGKATLVCHG